MTVYESVIEICLRPVFDEATKRNDATREEFSLLRERYPVRIKMEK
jgi:hypothetical protein